MNWYNTSIPKVLRKVRWRLFKRCECLSPFFKERWLAQNEYPMGRCEICGRVGQVGEGLYAEPDEPRWITEDDMECDDDE